MKKIIYILTLILSFNCATLKAQNYITHKVKVGETLETIAQHYNIDKTSIISLNPDAKNGLTPNTQIIIPKKDITSQVPVQVSSQTITKEIKTLTGYKKHKVKRKETLYSLSKKYNVTEADIKKYNPFLYANNLRKGDKLQIPIFKIETIQVEKPKTINYTVLPKEGKWRIAYKYGITVKELEELNPNLQPVLQEGQIIKVPNLDSNNIKVIDEQYSYYTVLPKEGFYRIKIKTGVNQEELERLNPTIKTTGLKEGMVLKIPYKGVTNASNVVISQQASTANVNLAHYISDTSTKNIAVMLPFKLNTVNTDSIFDAKQKIKNDRTLALTLDFYSGVLIAFDSLKKAGINLKVDVYDTQNRQSAINTILTSNSFSNTDAVIGPLLSKNFNLVAQSLENKKTPVVSPITGKVNILSNVFQSRPNDAVLKSKIIEHFSKDALANIVIVTDAKHKTTSNALRSKFTNAAIVNSRVNKKTKKDAYYILEQDLLDVIKPGNNIVFLETDNPNFVSNVSSMLNALLVKGTNITLTTTNKNKAFEDEEVSNYHLSNLHFTYASIFKIVEEDSNNNFIRSYKNKYGESPNTYAIRGYDLTMDVVLRIVSSQNLHESVNTFPTTSYIENKFSYTQKPLGGFYNNAVYLVRYNNLKIEEIKQ